MSVARLSGLCALMLLALTLLSTCCSARVLDYRRLRVSDLSAMTDASKQQQQKMLNIVGPNNVVYNAIVVRNVSAMRVTHAYWNIPKPPTMVSSLSQRIEVTMSVFGTSANRTKTATPADDDQIDYIFETVFAWAPIDKVWKMYSGYYANGRYTMSKADNVTSGSVAECGVAHVPHSPHTWGIVTDANPASVTANDDDDDATDAMGRTMNMKKNDPMLRAHSNLIFRTDGIVNSRFVAFGVRSVTPLHVCSEFPSEPIVFRDIIMDPAVRRVDEYAFQTGSMQCNVKMTAPDPTQITLTFGDGGM